MLFSSIQCQHLILLPHCYESPTILNFSAIHLLCDERLLFFACIREDAAGSNCVQQGCHFQDGHCDQAGSTSPMELLLWQTAGCPVSEHSLTSLLKKISCRCSAQILPHRLGWTSICTWKSLRVISSLTVVQTAVTSPPHVLLSSPPSFPGYGSDNDQCSKPERIIIRLQPWGWEPCVKGGGTGRGKEFGTLIILWISIHA